MRFLADESCNFAVVAALRAADYDVVSVSELSAGSADDVVLRLARSEARVLLTEDKDFGVLAYAGGHETAGAFRAEPPEGAPLAQRVYRPWRARLD